MIKTLSFSLIVTLFFCSAAVATKTTQSVQVVNTNTASPPAKGMTAVKEKTVDDFVTQYATAARLEEKTYQELLILEDRYWELHDIHRYADNLTTSFTKAQDAAKNGINSYASLPGHARTSLSARDSALKTINKYLALADEAVKALSAFAKAGPYTAERAAQRADAAINNKTELKNRATASVRSAKDASKEYQKELSNLLRHNTNRRKHLEKIQEYRGEILHRSNRLQSQIKDEDTKQGRAIHNALTTLSEDLEPIVGRSAEVVHKEQDDLNALIGALKKMQESEKKLTALLDACFKSAATAVVKKESHLFLSTLLQQEKADASVQTELKSSASALAASLTEIDHLKKSILEQSAAAGKLQDTLIAEYTKSPYNLAEIDTLIVANSKMVAQFDNTLRAAKAEIEAKRKEYETARQVADELYSLAYDDERPSEYGDEQIQASTDEIRNVEQAVIGVVEHVYAHVYTLQEEPEGYGAYTYVLFRQNYPGAQRHIEERYKALLEAIYRSTSSTQDFSADIGKEKLNLFCIPYKRYTREKKKVEAYDADLARSYLATASGGAILRRDIIKRLAQSAGPFLLTTRTRLSRGSSEKQLLFVDLSLYPPEAFDSILAVYKNTLVEYPPQGEQVWTPHVLQRIVYFGISASNAIPELVDKIDDIVDFFVPSAQAGPATLR